MDRDWTAATPARSGALGLAAVGLLLALPAAAQERGFAAHRLAGTTVGARTFLVERPWYSSTRRFAGGVSADWSHGALLPAVATGRGPALPIVEHALRGHVELAGALFDRVLLSAALPVTLLETGATELVSQAGPLRGVAAGDPRVGVWARLAGQPEEDPVSLHLGVDVWVPLADRQGIHQGDGTVRVLPRALLAGAFGPGRWSVEAGFLWRRYASIGPPALGMTAAPELRAGAAFGASLLGDRLYLGPEVLFSTQVLGANAFAARGMSLELLAGASLLLFGHVQVGVAGGAGLLGAAGTPDARAVLRVAWAPGPAAGGGARTEVPPPPVQDADGDGVDDAADRCPFEPETRNGIRDGDGCPEYALEAGTPLARVLAPGRSMPPGPGVAAAPSADAGATQASAVQEPMAAPASGGDAGTPAGAPAPDAPDVARADAFRTADSDADGVPDEADRCPVTPEDRDDFEDEDGCPEPDNDLDGVPDAVDRCPAEAETVNGEQDDDGCPDQAPDADGDGVADALDRCPLEPETRDGYRDADGCPESTAPWQVALARLLRPGGPPPPAADASAAPVARPDSDADGVPDEEDRCPVTPEDRDGFEDEDGCPEPDNDGDGVADPKDRCPDAAETVNGWQDEDGCPDEHPDADGDGVDWALDRCPLEPAKTPDGCPHAPLPALALPGFFGAPVPADGAAAVPAPGTGDLDRDGVPDDADPCPVTAEDRDGFEDEDGCPEPDNDRDGIADARDRCPLEAEVINGVQDDDGCPDRGAGAVTVTAKAVVIDGVVNFKPGSATLQPASFGLLRQVAATLRAASSLSVEIQGHTDDTGSAADNIKLSRRRAETIRAFLVKNGVAPRRLVANGYGPTRPRASNKTPEGREQNRRVEFLILGEAK